MFAMFLVPFGNAGCLVHVLDDLPPTDSSIVGTKRNLSELSGIWNDAHLSAAEVVIEQILEPHSCDEQEIPRITSTLLDIVHRPIAGDFAIAPARQTERLVELLHDI